MRRYRGSFRLSDAFCPNQFSVGYTINIFGSDLRQGQEDEGRRRQQKPKTRTVGKADQKCRDRRQHAGKKRGGHADGEGRILQTLSEVRANALTDGEQNEYGGREQKPARRARDGRP
jgi:hypothetical protein